MNKPSASRFTRLISAGLMAGLLSFAASAQEKTTDASTEKTGTKVETKTPVTPAPAPLPALTEQEQALMKAIGAKLDSDQNIELAGIKIDRRTKIISFKGYWNIREGVIEVIVSTIQGRAHESLIISDADPFKLQLALILAGGRNGPILEDSPIPMGSAYEIKLVYQQKGVQKVADVNEFLFDNNVQKPAIKAPYIFVGSNFQDSVCLASVEGNLINLNSGDNDTIVNVKMTPDEINREYLAVTEKIPTVRDVSHIRNPKPEDYRAYVEVRLIPLKDLPKKQMKPEEKEKPAAPAAAPDAGNKTESKTTAAPAPEKTGAATR